MMQKASSAENTKVSFIFALPATIFPFSSLQEKEKKKTHQSKYNSKIPAEMVRN